MRTSPPQVAFSSGEISPLLHQRFDYQRNQTGLAQCRGFLPLAEGGFTRAPGSWYRGNTDGNSPAVLVPFQFAANDAVVLEFSALKMRVWRYGALVMDGPSPYELVTPFDADDIDRLDWVQTADVITICDGVHPAQRLSRFALDNWTIEAEVYDTGPYRVQNLDEALTVQASAETGSITLTASASLFTADMIGSLMLLQPTDYTTIPLWQAYETVAVNEKRRYEDKVFELTQADGADVGVTPPLHSEGEVLVDPDTKWLYLTDDRGVVRITAVTDPTHATATVIRRVPQACVDDPTYRWSEGAWSEKSGYPSRLELIDQRMVFAATPAEPRSLWFSAVGDFRDFDPGVEADQSFAYTIAGDGSINQIVGLKRGKSGLHIFALGEEYSTRSETRAQAIGPTTAVFSLDSSIGSSGARPIAPDGDPIFISADQARVLVVSYSLDRDANQSVILSRAARHLGSEGFSQIVWQGAPDATAWLRRGNGELAAMIYERAEDVLGWASLPVAGGFVESMAVTRDATGTRDVLTLIVRRVVNGVTRRFVEELAPVFGTLATSDDSADACHFYAASSFTEDPATDTFSVPHLAGQTVWAWTDKGNFGPLTVGPTGAVELELEVTRATIGLFDTTHVAETLNIQAAAPDGNAMGRQKRLHTGTTIGLHRTTQVLAQTVERRIGRDPIYLPAEKGRELVPHPLLVQQVAAVNGIAKLDLPSGHAPEVAIRITPWGGAPATITAIVPTVQEAGA